MGRILGLSSYGKADVFVTEISYECRGDLTSFYPTLKVVKLMSINMWC